MKPRNPGLMVMVAVFVTCAGAQDAPETVTDSVDSPLPAQVADRLVSELDELEARLGDLESERRACDMRLSVVEEALRESEAERSDLRSQMSSRDAAMGERVRGLAKALERRAESLEARIVMESEAQGARIDALQRRSSELTRDVVTLADRADRDFRDTTARVRKSRAVGVGAIALVAVGAGMGFEILRRRQRQESDASEARVRESEREIREECLKIDTGIVQALEAHMDAVRKHAGSGLPGASNGDHTIALRVADELVRLEKNVSRMDESTKGLKQIRASIGRVKDTLDASGYEIVELLGKPFDPGMRLIATCREDPEREAGVEIITRIVKPQVNFRGQMIQTAQVEVSQGTGRGLE